MTQPLPHADIVAFVRERRLPAEDTAVIASMLARLSTATFATSEGAEATVDLTDPEGPERVGPTGPAPRAVTPAEPETTPARYEDLGPIGAGGMGEVRRVRDRELGRTCAYKVIRADLAARTNVVARFIEEAQVAAQLQHPNIAPVYDAGRLPDGRAWFTMKEVRGRTLTELIREVHGGDVSDAALRRLGDHFARICDGVGYAHARGVVHRDLKPDNVMIGAHGEVLVLDWGLAKLLGRPDHALDDGDWEPEVASNRSADVSQKTRAGGVMGTAAYMPPEQAMGRVDTLDARADVYALGAILYEVLAGRAPYQGRDARAVLEQVLAGPPPPPPGQTLPEELVALCLRCMARDPADRPVDGSAVATEARAWLDGAHKRERALEVVSLADAVVEEMTLQRERAATLRAEGEALLAPVPPWAPEDEKAAGWARQDEAERADRDAVLLELKREALLQGALTHAPDLAEGHAALAELELDRHQEAEAERQERRMARAEVRLREHMEALPEGHEVRRRAAAYLRGDGALTLHTDAPGACVELYEYEIRNRRRAAVWRQTLGRTPLVEVPLPMGSYLCVVRHPERAEVRYPVHISRGHHWDGVAPHERSPRPIRLPLVGDLGPDDCLIPAGWFWSGGDVEAVDALPPRRLWCHELVMKRHPTTNREYIVFLDDLVATGRESEALRHQPCERGAGDAAPIYGRDHAGRFVLRPDTDGDVWDPDWPVFLVDWFGASAYARWLADRTGRPWALPAELEWEKAARGVDGRFFPWGDGFDPSWTCIRASHAERGMPAVVEGYPVDESVYGVRGLGGNVHDWCADVFQREGPPLHGDASVSNERPESTNHAARVIRGSSWLGTARLARAAGRSRLAPDDRYEHLGFRLAFRV